MIELLVHKKKYYFSQYKASEDYPVSQGCIEIEIKILLIFVH